MERQQSFVEGSTLTCHNMCYSVPVTNGPCKPKSSKQILRNVNVLFKPGMNAILGPTGSGKSSLLDVLAGRKDPSGLSGLVLVDGHRQPKNFKCLSGYVVQEDIVMGTLSVRENLMFSAALRLPSRCKKEERQRRVEEVILELGLGKVADSRVGTEFIRGISGGEKKRCNIGMELITRPAVLFLDEPTTGLDASTANAVMTLLHRLGKMGRTIVFSIHQPRYSIFRLFDNLALLGAGKMIYHGPSKMAIDHFASMGYECEAYNNPPDFFLDIINGDSTAVQQTADTGGSSAHADANNGSFTAGTKGEESVAIHMGRHIDEQPEDLVNSLHENYEQSHTYKSLMQDLEAIEQTFSAQTTVVEIEEGSYSTNFFQQFSILSQRCVKNLWRSPQASILQLVVMLIFGAVVGGLYWNVDNTIEPGVQNRIGAFFFVIMNMIFGNMSAVELFIKERVIFIHENVSGYYRVSAYFFAKILSDSIPMRTLPTIIFATVVYFMIGFQNTFQNYITFVLALLMTTWAATAIAFIISASVNVFGIATLLTALSYVLSMIFGGLLVNLDSIADWLSWLKYLSLFRYGLNALSVNELHGLGLYSTFENGTKMEYIPDAGDSALKTTLGVTYENPWTLWQNFVALGAMMVGFFTLGYVQLRRMKKLK